MCIRDSCGAEVETDDPNVNGLRRRLIKNAFAALLCSRGPAIDVYKRQIVDSRLV